jgi:hypothetical protein
MTKKVKEILYVDNPKERDTEYSTGIILVFEDDSTLELMTTDVVANRYNPTN